MRDDWAPDSALARAFFEAALHYCGSEYEHEAKMMNAYDALRGGAGRHDWQPTSPGCFTCTACGGTAVGNLESFGGACSGERSS